jgi:hypothetical protein
VRLDASASSVQRLPDFEAHLGSVSTGEDADAAGLERPASGAMEGFHAAMDDDFSSPCSKSRRRARSMAPDGGVGDPMAVREEERGAP